MIRSPSQCPGSCRFLDVDGPPAQRPAVAQRRPFRLLAASAGFAPAVSAGQAPPPCRVIARPIDRLRADGHVSGARIGADRVRRPTRLQPLRRLRGQLNMSGELGGFGRRAREHAALWATSARYRSGRRCSPTRAGPSTGDCPTAALSARDPTPPLSSPRSPHARRNTNAVPYSKPPSDRLLTCSTGQSWPTCRNHRWSPPTIRATINLPRGGHRPDLAPASVWGDPENVLSPVFVRIFGIGTVLNFAQER